MAGHTIQTQIIVTDETVEPVLSIVFVAALGALKSFTVELYIPCKELKRIWVLANSHVLCDSLTSSPFLGYCLSFWLQLGHLTL